MIKTLKADKDTNPELIAALKKADNLNTTEKKLKNDIKRRRADLHLATKAAIENLTDEDARMLLHEKWIHPVCSGIQKLSDEMITSLLSIETLSKKYAVTMSELEKEIQETEKSLVTMLDDLDRF